MAPSISISHFIHLLGDLRLTECCSRVRSTVYSGGACDVYLSFKMTTADVFFSWSFLWAIWSASGTAVSSGQPHFRHLLEKFDDEWKGAYLVNASFLAHRIFFG